MILSLVEVGRAGTVIRMDVEEAFAGVAGIVFVLSPAEVDVGVREIRVVFEELCDIRRLPVVLIVV